MPDGNSKTQIPSQSNMTTDDDLSAGLSRPSPEAIAKARQLAQQQKAKGQTNSQRAASNRMSSPMVAPRQYYNPKVWFIALGLSGVFLSLGFLSKLTKNAIFSLHQTPSQRAMVKPVPPSFTITKTSSGPDSPVARNALSPRASVQLALAKTLAEKGDLGRAIETALEVTSQMSDYQEAQGLISQWQVTWKSQNDWYRYAEISHQGERWQECKTALQELPNNDYWLHKVQSIRLDCHMASMRESLPEGP